MESREERYSGRQEQLKEEDTKNASGTEEECETDVDLFNMIMVQASAGADGDEYADDASFAFEKDEEDESSADSLDSLPEAEIIRNNLYIL
jgi:hypothetical protein